jgi:hypothetical protein
VGLPYDRTEGTPNRGSSERRILGITRGYGLLTAENGIQTTDPLCGEHASAAHISPRHQRSPQIEAMQTLMVR